MSAPTREEFERMYDTIKDGFRGVHERLDVLNGRTGKGEVDRENLRTRVVGLEKTVFRTEPRRHGDPRSEEHSTERAQAAAFFTTRERWLIALGFAIVAAVVKATLIAGDATFEAVKTLLKGAH